MKYIELLQERGISHIILKRPERLNAMNQEMLKELKEVIKEVEENHDLVVMLSGDGEAFCAGGDISMMKDVQNHYAYTEVMDDIEEIVTRLYLMPKMVVSAIQGACVGLGLSLALSTDYVIVRHDAKISMNFIGVGLVPDGGGHFWLQQRLGIHKAKSLIYQGTEFNGREAQDQQLIDEVTTHDVVEEALRIARLWQKRPLQAMIGTKLVYHRSEKKALFKFLKEERNWQWKMRQTDDHQEAVSAFLEKRKPQFSGK